MIVIVLLFFVTAVYVACFYPEWIWAMLVGSTLVLDLVLLFMAGGTSAGAQAGANIAIGSLQLRTTDPALLGFTTGSLYYLYRSSSSVFKRKPLLTPLVLILVFAFLKVAWTLIFGQEQLAANQIVSHTLGGIVAAVGELRDDLFEFLIPIYVYLVPRSRDLKLVAWPLVVSVLLIMLRAAAFIAVTGQIWSSNASFRYITAEQAIELTVIGFILLFLQVPRLSKGWSQALACFALVMATVANHRSQWVSLASGGAILIAFVLGGRPLIGNRKKNRLIVASSILFLVCLTTAASELESYAAQNPILSSISVRLYAITRPSKDADASWRQAIWHDRITQVGANWPWGRLLGDRRLTLYHGAWLSVPDHSAYVTSYEIGGVILCALIGAFWISVIFTSMQYLRIARIPEQIWPPVVALAITVCSLAFGTAYDFPILGPVFVVILLLNAQQRLAVSKYPRYPSPARLLDSPLQQM